MFINVLFLCLFLLLYYVVKYFEKTHSYWGNLGVDTPKYYYFVGNILDQFLHRRSIGTIVTDVYNEFEGYNYVGFYNSTKPAVIIRNPDIIETILVKEFSSFHDNDIDVDKNNLITTKNPFLLNGEEWKTVRGQISPCYTTNKTKQLLPMLHKTSRQFLDYLKTFPPIGINAKDLISRYTTENVSNCVFSIKGESFETKPEEKPINSSSSSLTFFTATYFLLNSSTKDKIKSFLISVFPFLAKILLKDTKTEHINAFLTNIIKDSLKYRRDNKIIRNDMLDFLQERREKINDDSVFNLADIRSHASVFITDGIDTNCIVLQHFLYELGNNQLIQDKIRAEIYETKRHMSRKQELSYEMIQGMTYLDAVFNEVLRLHPQFSVFIKRVTRPFTLGPMRKDNSGPSVTLPVGMSVLIPILGLHTDRSYHESPQNFNPERFLDGNKEKIEKFTFLPFGAGPRKCLGLEFGTLQTKLVIITLVEHYEIRVNNKTKEVIESDPGSFVNVPRDGYWIDFINLETT